MKIGPVIEALSPYPALTPILVHTGQHYDAEMSKVFFDDLGLPEPDVYLGVGSGTHSGQTAKVLVGFEAWAEEHSPDYVLVVGDVNSTLACSLVAAKRRIRLGHVEAGLRSYDRDMPEEINRLVTDAVADELFTSCEGAEPNLLKEGVDPGKIHFVGNVMIDSLIRHRDQAWESTVLGRLGLEEKKYTLVTLHRPSNVDEPKVFQGILSALGTLSEQKPVMLPVHPRTRKRIEEFGLSETIARFPGLRLVDPLGYLDFLRLMGGAALVVTDSGGIQEETTFLGIPCLTVRLNTERPVTVTEGTNEIVGTNPDAIRKAGLQVLTGKEKKKGTVPKFWDGKSGDRIAKVLNQIAENKA